jgi:transcriptional regulator with XRE-family HTH domain
MHFGNNVNYLRKLMKMSQDDIAAHFNVKRSTISGWEGGSSTPNFDTLVKLAQIFEVTIDALIYTDLEASKFHPDYKHAAKEVRIARSYGPDPKTTNLLIPVAAQAGYATEWSQEQYSAAQVVQVPGIEGEARTWEVAGDSMLPLIAPGDYVSGKRLASGADLINGGIYVLVTRTQGIHLKHVTWVGQYLCTPANGKYEPYHLEVDEVREIWDVRLRITRNVLQPPIFGTVEKGVWMPVLAVRSIEGEITGE